MAAKLRTSPKQKRGNPNWRKGGPSPNPGGRPGTANVAQASREWLAEAGNNKTNARALVEKLGKSALDGDWQAARLLIEYAEGKPRQGVDLNVTDQARQEWAEAQLARVMDALKLEREEAAEWMRTNTPTAAQWIN